MKRGTIMSTLSDGEAKLYKYEPFYAYLMSHVKLVEDATAGTAGIAFVDGRIVMYYNPEFINSLTDDAVAIILLHELGHVIRSHISPKFFRSDINREVMNVAMDATINPEFADHHWDSKRLFGDLLSPAEDIVTKRIKKDKTFVGASSKLSDYTAEELYNELIKLLPPSARHPQNQPNPQQNQNNNQPQNGQQQNGQQQGQQNGQQQNQQGQQQGQQNGQQQNQQGQQQGQQQNGQQQGQQNGQSGQQNGQKQGQSGQGQKDGQQSSEQGGSCQLPGQHPGQQSSQSSSSSSNPNGTSNSNQTSQSQSSSSQSQQVGPLQSGQMPQQGQGQFQKVSKTTAANGTTPPQFGANGQLDNHDIMKRSNGTEEEVVETVRNAIESATREAGTVPARIRDIVDALKNWKPELDWKKILRHFIGSTVTEEREPTIARYDKRYGAPILGDLPKTRGEVVIGMDVSCSVSDHELQLFVNEVKKICDILNTKLTIIQGDTEVEDISKIKKNTKEFKRRGGGGTELQPIVDAAAKMKKDLILFTDGYLSQGLKIKRKRTLIVVTSDGTTDIDAKGARIIQMPKEKRDFDV